MGPVDEQKKELCKQAYLLISKYLHVSGKEGQETFEFRKNLRKKDALDIDLATNKEVLSELSKFKEQGGAALLTSGGSSLGAGGGAAKATKSIKGAGGGAGGPAGAGLPPLGPGSSVAAAGRSAAKPTKSASKGGGKADAGAMPASLPPRIGAKVSRWWPQENAWFVAIVTDYNSETNCYRLTYNLGSQNETYEDFNLDVADTSIYSFTGEKVNLLAKTSSAAVNSSIVLRPFLTRIGANGRGGGSKASSKKKRRSDSDDDDDDSDY